MIIRLRYKLLGGHVHCRLFTSKAKNMTFAKCGDLVFSVTERDDVRDMLHSAVEILADESDAEVAGVGH